MGQFEGALAGMNDTARDRALSQIFTDQGLRPMQLLLQQGSGKLVDFRSQLDNANGSAESFANQIRDNATGDVASFWSALEGLRLQIWELVRGPFRALVQASTDWLRANQDVIAGGLRGFVEFLSDNLPTIALWARRIAIAFAVVATPLLVIAAAFTAAILAIPALIVGAVTLAIAAFEWLRDASSGTLTALSAVALGVLGPFMAVPALIAGVVAGVVAAWDSISGFFVGATEFVVGLFVLMRRQVQAVWQPIGAAFARIWAQVVATFGPAVSSLLERARGLLGRFRAVWSPLVGFFSRLWSAIASIFEGTVGGVLDQVARVVENVRGVGRGELDGDAPPPPAVRNLTADGVGSQVRESINTERAEVVIRPEGARAEVTRRPRGNGVALRVPASGGV